MNRFTLFILILFTFLASCSDDNKEEVLLVGTSADNPPFEYLSSGEIVGLDVDIINAVAKYLGKKITIKDLEFYSLLGALNTGNLDLAIAAMGPTKARAKMMDFSIPYSNSTIVLLYRKQDSFISKESLRDKLIGVSSATIWVSIADSLSKHYGSKTKVLSNNLILVKELQQGLIDAVILEKPQAVNFINIDENLTSLDLKEDSGSYAIAMPKGSKLLNDVNKAIRHLQDNGTITRLEKKWNVRSD